MNPDIGPTSRRGDLLADPVGYQRVLGKRRCQIGNCGFYVAPLLGKHALNHVRALKTVAN